jgi:CheY-like chemotaxis protein
VTTQTSPKPSNLSEDVRRSLLVVDDDPDFRQMLCDYARHLGCPTWEATNGLEALWLVKHEHPDIVLLDIRMPRLNGLDTIRHIQKFDPTIRIIIVTGDGTDATRARIERLGLPLLLKPVSLETVRSLLTGDEPHKTSYDPSTT